MVCVYSILEQNITGRECHCQGQEGQGAPGNLAFGMVYFKFDVGRNSHYILGVWEGVFGICLFNFVARPG